MTNKTDEKDLRIALINLEKMVEDRGYIEIYNGIPELDIIKRHEDREYITPSGKFALTTIIDLTSKIKNYTKYIEDPAYETIIFVYTNNFTITHKTIEIKLNFKIEIWCVNSLLINVMSHCMQPKIEKINYEIKGRIPKIDRNDPVVRYYRFQSKDILKITNSEGDIYFRIVS